jgi:shikimate dehydrogenase
MLLEQAVLQVRIFTAGSAEAPLPREDDVRAAMRGAAGLP